MRQRIYRGGTKRLREGCRVQSSLAWGGMLSRVRLEDVSVGERDKQGMRTYRHLVAVDMREIAIV